MRNGQKRMRGRGGHRKSQNPLTRVYESNGPDVKIRGTASHIAEKYIQLARDAQSSGDPVAAENYYQHAEHYFRLIAAAQEQFRQQNPYYQQQPQQGAAPVGDEVYDDEGEEGQPFVGQNEPSFVPREPQPQPYLPRDAQPFPPRDQQARPAPQYPAAEEQNAGGLPAFITGGNQPQPSAGSNGHDQGERGQERYGGGYRRRRRHRGGGFRERPDFAGGAQGAPQGDGGSEPQPGE
jgi:type II secretory pathway pseudopilin PulG